MADDNQMGVPPMPPKKARRRASSASTKTIKAPRVTSREEKHVKHVRAVKDEDKNVFSGGVVLLLAAVVGLLFYNQLQLFELSALAGVPGSFSVSQGFSGGTLSLSDGDKVAYGPVLLSSGEQPVLSGYRTKIKELPTISPQPKKPKTNDAVQDALNKIVPTGTPEYGPEIGVSFDDPIAAQRTLGALEQSVTLDASQEQRWARIVGSFTCDYCCGSPQQPTIITHCGCAHAGAWRGLARFLVKKYDDKVTDQQIFGELSKWKALWYPGPTVQRVLQEQAASGGKTSNAPVQIDQLPQMVGGC